MRAPQRSSDAPTVDDSLPTTVKATEEEEGCPETPLLSFVSFVGTLETGDRFAYL